MGKTSTIQQVPTTQKTDNSPWAPAQPALQMALDGAQNQFQKGPQQYYPGSTVAGLSGQTKAGLDGSFNFAQTAPGMAGFASGQLMGKAMGQGQFSPGGMFNAQTAMGGNSNPFMAGAANMANGPGVNTSGLEAASTAQTNTSGLQGFASGQQGNNPFMGQVARAGGRTNTSPLQGFASGQQGGNPFMGQIAQGGGQTNTAPLQGFASGQQGNNPFQGRFAQTAQQGASGPGTNLLTQVAGGGFLQNPYLQQAMTQAGDAARNNVNSIFAAGGRYGSGAHQDAMAKSVGEAVNPFLLQAYQGNMADMMSAGGALAGFEQQGLDRTLSAMGQDASLAEAGIGRQFDASGQLVSQDAASRARQLQGLQSAAGLQEAQTGRQYDASGQLVSTDASDRARMFQGSQAAAGLFDAQTNRQFGAAGQMAGINQADLARMQQGYGQIAGLNQADNAQRLSALQMGGGLYNQDISNALSAYLGMAGVNQANNAQQMQALGMLPQMYGLGQQGFQDMQNVGANIDAYNQTLIDADVARHDFNQQAPWQNIAQLNAIATGMGQLGGTSTTTGQQYFQRPTLFGSLLNAGSQAAAAWAGAQSDRRVKRDIVRLYTDDRGVPWYAFNYKTDAEGEAPRIGTMAQDLLKIAPQFVHADEETGIMSVDYGGLASWEGPRLSEAA